MEPTDASANSVFLKDHPGRPSCQELRLGSLRASFTLVMTLVAGALACARDASDRAGSDGPYLGQLVEPPLSKPDFQLTDTEGASFDFRPETEGFVTLLFFGYTHCPDVCPVHMSNIAAVLDDFSPEIRRRIKVVFVTTDPERDTPDRIREWLANFDPAFIGLRGTVERVNEIQRSLGLPPAMPQASDESGSYMVGHAAAVLVFTPDNLAHLRFPFGTRQQDLAHDLPILVREGWDAT